MTDVTHLGYVVWGGGIFFAISLSVAHWRIGRLEKRLEEIGGGRRSGLEGMPASFDLPCPRCGQRMAGNDAYEASYDDDGRQVIRWTIENRTGCRCIPDSELLSLLGRQSEGLDG